MDDTRTSASDENDSSQKDQAPPGHRFGPITAEIEDEPVICGACGAVLPVSEMEGVEESSICEDTPYADVDEAIQVVARRYFCSFDCMTSEMMADVLSHVSMRMED